MREDFKLRPEEDGSRIIGNLTINELNRRGMVNARDDVGDSGYGVHIMWSLKNSNFLNMILIS